MPSHQKQPTITGSRGVIASGHYLATAAGFKIMQNGGNAIDTAAATAFCLNLVEPHQNGLGGEVPVLVYSTQDKMTHTISGMGWSPQNLTIDWCRNNSIDLIPGDGLIPACVPATVGTWALALTKFGTMKLSQILEPAIDLAENGFPMYPALHDFITQHRQDFVDRFPSTADVYLPDGKVPEVGDIFRNPDFAETLKKICRAEDSMKHKGKITAIETGRDVFYKGEITEKIIDFITNTSVEDSSGKSHSGLLSYEDFAEWNASVEDPVSVNYRGLDVYKCSSWTQGPVFLQQLTILELFDLASMGHESPEYLHTWIECAKLAFADREAYYGDPLMDDVPLDILLSKEYASKRRDLINKKASMKLRPGDVGKGVPDYVTFDVIGDNRKALGLEGLATSVDHSRHARVKPGDTTQLVVIDKWGNMVSATPSGGWIQSSPVIKDLGFPLGTRAQMFYLNPSRPNALEPRKRPRTTLTPTLVTKNGDPFMAFGTPGGDAQDQWTLQFFLNFVDFGMDIQTALDSPHWKIEHMPLSFYPRDAFPGKVSMDSGISDELVNELKNRGHDVHLSDMPIRMMGAVIDSVKGSICAGVSSSSATGCVIGW